MVALNNEETGLLNIGIKMLTNTIFIKGCLEQCVIEIWIKVRKGK